MQSKNDCQIDSSLQQSAIGQGRFFYGWWIVLSCAIVSIWAGGIFYSVTAFIDPIVDEFGWSYFLVSLAAALRSVEMGLMAPAMGFLVDRFGPRMVVSSSGLLTGAGFLLLSRTTSLLTFYVAFVVLSIGWSGLGQVTTTTAIAGWFRKRIGLATGIVVAGYGIGGVMVPVNAWLIELYGWQSAMAILGIATWLVVLIPSLLLRHRPEKYGYLPDGERHNRGTEPQKVKLSPSQSEPEYTVKLALAAKVFWIIAFAYMIQFMVTNAVTLHIMPYLLSVSLPLETASLAAMLIPILSVLGRLSFGWLGDLFGQKYLLAISFLLQAVSLVLLLSAQVTSQLVLFLAMFGPAIGGSLVLRSTLIRVQFGRRSFGSIQGLVVAVMTVGGILGPAFAGWVFDVTGSYGIAWIVLAALTVVAGATVLLVRRPRPAAVPDSA